MKHKCFLALLAAGIVFGAYQYFHPQGLSLGPGNEMVAEARTFVQEGTIGDPFRSMKTGPTATNPPLYPLFLAFCLWFYPTSSFYFITAVLPGCICRTDYRCPVPDATAAIGASERGS